MSADTHDPNESIVDNVTASSWCYSLLTYCIYLLHLLLTTATTYYIYLLLTTWIGFWLMLDFLSADDGYGWYGTLSTMEPGVGYKLKIVGGSGGSATFS